MIRPVLRVTVSSPVLTAVYIIFMTPSMGEYAISHMELCWIVTYGEGVKDAPCKGSVWFTIGDVWADGEDICKLNMFNASYIVWWKDGILFGATSYSSRVGRWDNTKPT